MRIFAVDPGESNGWCILEAVNRKACVISFGVEKRLDFYSRLEALFSDVDRVICEGWLTRPKDAKIGAFDWDSMPAAQVIGALECYSLMRGIPFVIQQPSMKPVGYGFLGKTYKKGAKNVHHWDALAHGMYYLVKQGLAEPN